LSKSLPKLKDLEKGLVACDSCGARLPLGEHDKAPLEIHKCMGCSRPVFYPMRVKDFWLYEPLGGGGMGSVYKAISSRDPRKLYAVKILPRNSKFNTTLIKAILTEGEIGARLGKHKNIVETVDYGQDGDEHFMATEFISGQRLDMVVESAETLAERQAIEIVLQIIDAEEHIVASGYLFRDVKPENVIVEPDGNVRLFDFGLCQTLEKAASMNSSGYIEGSPYYIPPERIVGAPEGEYSEIYSIGMLLFYMLAGKTYFSKATYSRDELKGLMMKHVASPRLPSVAPNLKGRSEKLISILDKMIYRIPKSRYLKLAPLRADLEAIHGQYKRGDLSRRLLWAELGVLFGLILAGAIKIFIDRVLAD